MASPVVGTANRRRPPSPRPFHRRPARAVAARQPRLDRYDMPAPALKPSSNATAARLTGHCDCSSEDDRAAGLGDGTRSVIPPKPPKIARRNQQLQAQIQTRRHDHQGANDQRGQPGKIRMVVGKGFPGRPPTPNQCQGSPPTARRYTRPPPTPHSGRSARHDPRRHCRRAGPPRRRRNVVERVPRKRPDPSDRAEVTDLHRHEDGFWLGASASLANAATYFGPRNS